MNRTMTSLLGERLKHLYIGRSGITGLETAIVLIAFVVVAAVFAFTVLTTGLFTSEKAKETVMSGVSSQTSMELVGSVIAGGTNLGNDCRTANPVAGAPIEGGGAPPFENMVRCDIDWNFWNQDPPENHVQTIRFTLKPAAGAGDIPFDPSKILITYSDGVLAELFNFVTARAPDAVTTANADMRDHTSTSPEWERCRTGTDRPNFCISWSPDSNQDFLLEQGEWVEIFLFAPADPNPIHVIHAWRPGRRFQIEVIPQQGSILSFERRLPDVFRHVMDLG